MYLKIDKKSQFIRKKTNSRLDKPARQKFYSTGLNYWTDISDSESRTKKKDGELVSYEYNLYDLTKKIISKA